MSILITVYILSIYCCIFMYLRLRLFFPLGGTGRDDIAARLLLYQLHTTAEANHSMRTDICSKSVEGFVLTCKVVWFEDVWNVICHLFFSRFGKLESIEIRSDFCGTAAPNAWPGFNGFNLWLGWHVGSGQTILQRRFLENACDLAWLEALLYLKGMM